MATDALVQYAEGICISKHQIPLDEQSFNVEFADWDPIQLLNFDQKPDSTILENNGKTLVITMNYTENVPTVTMGPFQYVGPFRFDHLYWHWLKSPNHKFYGMSISAELHLVFYDASYASLEEASKQPYSIAILAFNIMAIEYSLADYDKIVEEVVSIGDGPYRQTALSPDKILPLQSYVLPDSSKIEDYSTYEGSWDTNLCTGIVLWVDFLFPLAIQSEFIYDMMQMRGINNQTFLSQSVETNTPESLIRQPRPRKDGVSTKSTVLSNATAKFSNCIGVCVILCVTMCMQLINQWSLTKMARM